MLRIAFIIVIGIHGAIHLFGFLQAFEIAEFSLIDQPISQLTGLFYLLAFLLFSITVVVAVIRSSYWWIPGFLAAIVSQALIFSYWSDIKYGTLANIAVLVTAILGYASFKFKQNVKQERAELLKSSSSQNKGIISKADVSTLPPAVQKWLIHSGAMEKDIVSNVFLTQVLQLKLKPEQTSWHKGTANQYFSIDPPAFNWTSTIEMNPLLNVVGRDKFKDGKGEMLIKLLSLLPIANAKNDAKIDQATLQRFLAEIVWFPSAALSTYIEWEHINEYSAKATLEFNGTKGSGVFYFNDGGLFHKFIASRYKDASDTKPTQWTVIATKTEDVNGILIPTECEANWKLDNVQWTWLKLRIEHIEYNVKNVPTA